MRDYQGGRVGGDEDVVGVSVGDAPVFRVQAEAFVFLPRRGGVEGLKVGV